MAEEWTEADVFESEQQLEVESRDFAGTEGACLTLRTPSLRSLHSEATAVNSPAVPARHCEEDGKQASKKRAFFAAEELVFALDGEEEECDDEDEEQVPPAKLQDRRALAEGVDIKAWCQRGTADFCPPHTWCQSLPAQAPSLEAAFLPGSVLEGRGRKLTGTSAMRLRNTVLQQTGFLEQRTAK